MSRRGNCHDNAVAESFCQLLKREHIRKHIYATRQEARSDCFTALSADIRLRIGLSPVEFERRNSVKLANI